MLTSTNATAASGDLRALRRAAGLSQQELATRAACSISYVRLLEQGFAPEHSDVLPRVLRALDFDPHNGESQPGKLAFSKNAGGAAHATG